MQRVAAAAASRLRSAALRRGGRAGRPHRGCGPAAPVAARAVPTRACGTQSGDGDAEEGPDKYPIDLLLEEITARAAGVKGAPPLEEAVQMSDDDLFARYPPKFLVVVAMSLFSGAGVQQDQARAVGLWRRMTDEDLSDEATYSYAMALRQGTPPLKKDPEAAALLLQRVADRDFGWGCHALAAQYELGEGVRKDPERAVELHLKAAALGIVRSYTLLGDMFFQGRGVDADRDKAEEYFRKGAAGGDAPAMHNLSSLLLERGAEATDGGAAAPPPEAFEWMKRAADAFYPPSLVNLALSCLQKEGSLPVPHDPARAATLMQSAAVRGFPPAMIHLAFLFLNGVGVAKSPKNALYWAQMAEVSGYPGMGEAIEHIRTVGAAAGGGAAPQ